jgi:hypothetical protein
MKKVVVVAVFLALLLGGPALHSQTKQPGSRVGKVMVEKLKHAKLLLEGIALGDFDKIINSSEELIQLSKTAEWHVIKTPRYEMFSNEFRRAADVMIQKAKIKNLDGVTLSYFELTMSCVRCHAYVREVREAGLPGVRPEIALGQTPAPR